MKEVRLGDSSFGARQKRVWNPSGSQSSFRVIPRWSLASHFQKALCIFQGDVTSLLPMLSELPLWPISNQEQSPLSLNLFSWSTHLSLYIMKPALPFLPLPKCLRPGGEVRRTQNWQVKVEDGLGQEKQGEEETMSQVKSSSEWWGSAGSPEVSEEGAASKHLGVWKKRRDLEVALKIKVWRSPANLTVFLRCLQILSVYTTAPLLKNPHMTSTSAAHLTSLCPKKAELQQKTQASRATCTTGPAPTHPQSAFSASTKGDLSLLLTE